MGRLKKLLIWLLIVPWIFYNIFFALSAYGGNTTRWIGWQGPHPPDLRTGLVLYLTGLVPVSVVLPFSFPLVLPLRDTSRTLLFILSLSDFTTCAIGALVITFTLKRLLSLPRKFLSLIRRHSHI